MRKRPPLRFYLFVLLLVALLAIFPLYSSFKQAAAPIPPGVQLGGIDLSHEKDPALIRAALEPIFRQPIGLRFRDRILVLHPEEIDFTVDVDAMIAAAGQYLEGVDFVDIALREAIGLPQQPRQVPVVYRLRRGEAARLADSTGSRIGLSPCRCASTGAGCAGCTASHPNTRSGRNRGGRGEPQRHDGPDHP